MLTGKPDDFRIRAIPRKGKPHFLVTLSLTLPSAAPASAQDLNATAGTRADRSNVQQLRVLYGPSAWGSKSFAERLALDT